MLAAWAGVGIRVLILALRAAPGVQPARPYDSFLTGFFALFVACGLVFFASTVMEIRRTRADFARAVHAARISPGMRKGRPQEFSGGARFSNLFQASWPLARLTVEPARLTLHMPLLGPIVIPAARVVAVRPKRGFLSRGGLRVETSIGGEHVTFFPMSDRAAVMRALQSAGYPCPTTPSE